MTILRVKQAEEDVRCVSSPSIEAGTDPDIASPQRVADIIQSRLSVLKDRARYMQTLSPPISAVHTPSTARSTPSPRLPGIHAALATSRQVDELHERRGGRVDLAPPASAWQSRSQPQSQPSSQQQQAHPSLPTPSESARRLSNKSTSSCASVVSDLVDGRSPTSAPTRRSLSAEGWESKSAVSPKAPGLEMLLNAVKADGQ